MGNIIINMERTGGVSGINLNISLESDNLAQEEADQLGQLINSSGVLHLQSKAGKITTADQFYYSFAIEKDKKKYYLELPEQKVPEALQPLINFLISKARRKS